MAVEIHPLCRWVHGCYVDIALAVVTSYLHAVLGEAIEQVYWSAKGEGGNIRVKVDL